jgi:predicted mannosyl-3-phosphoglycerate phosphatase (HAD superfamily)
MSKLWEDLKTNMRAWGSAAVEKAEEVSKIAVAKTEELTRVSKLKIDIHQLQRDRNKTLEELGRLAYGQVKKDNLANFTGNTEFFDLIQKIEDFNTSIKAKEEEIQKIQEEYNLNEAEISSVVSAMEEKQEEPEAKTEAAAEEAAPAKKPKSKGSKKAPPNKE